MEYRRANVAGGTYFFTVVTEKRQKILCLPKNVSLLRDAFGYVMQKHPFIIDAVVILPDHLHCIWTLPENDQDFSTRWRLIKSYFSRKCETISPENISLYDLCEMLQLVPLETNNNIHIYLLHAG